MNRGQPKIKILISCHKPSVFLSNNILEPIQLNCANSKNHFKDTLHDDKGDNISKLNPMYCELTAQYWAWKNLDVDYYGFCHYRRYFNFSSNVYEEDAFGNVVEQYPGKYAIEKYGLDEDTIRSVIGDNDIIITTKKDIRNMPGDAKTTLEQYQQAPLLHGKDILAVQKIIDEKTPEYSEAAKQFLNGPTTCFCNMYILKKEIFFEYCEWLFMILDEFCKRTDMDKYSVEALRTPGHLSERLFNIFLIKKTAENSNLKVKELQSVFFQKTDPQPPIEPIFKQKSVPIVMAANNAFVPVFATCLQSIIDTSSANNNYDIVLIQSDITPENKQILSGMVADHKNISLRFYDAATLLADYKLEARQHISVETYYRFLIQEAMPSYDKVLYIDCDIIVKRDLAELFNTNVNGYMLAATLDPDFIGQYNGAYAMTKRYAEETLELKDPYTYFQAGIILFNEKEMRKAHTLTEWLNFCTRPYRYSDQDVLNVFCQGHVKYLDMAWNMIYDCNHDRIEKVIKFAPKDIQTQYLAAHNNPNIIHYAGFMKPWHNPYEEYSQDFWQAARKTPYYEQLLYSMNTRYTKQEIDIYSIANSFTVRNRNRAKTVARAITRLPKKIIRRKNDK